MKLSENHYQQKNEILINKLFLVVMYMGNRLIFRSDFVLSKFDR